MTTAHNAMNLSDLPLVDPNALALPMRYMVETGRGLAMLRDISKEVLREVDQAVWGALADDPVQRVAVLVRFRSLVRVFASRRLADLMLDTGYNLIAPAVQVAARMRLNADLGFNPLKFERALRELMDKIAEGHQRRAETAELLAA
jgi:hypothetical protein